jgi:low temperature requirement protein LtrA
MRTSRPREASRTPADRVTPAEIFFDVVFVFTLTQLTRTLEEELSLASVGRVLLLFGILWLVYDGYVWLPNHVSPRSAGQKVVLFVGMAGFLIAAVGIPHAFTNTAVTFAVGYAVVTCIHPLMFIQAGVGRALWQLAPYTLGALLVLGGAFAGGTAQSLLWLSAFVLQAVSPFVLPVESGFGGLSAFHLATEHFVERHGLLVIIALGESVVAIGMGVDIDHLNAGTVAVTVLALALPAGLWWAYYTDTRATEAVLEHAENGPRVRLGVWLGYAHTPLLLGIVFAAVGIHAAVAHPGDPEPWASAVALAGGVAVFLVGIAAARRALHTAPPRSRLVTAAVVLATAPIGVITTSGLQLAVLVVVVVAMLVLDARTRTAAAHREPTVG